MIKVGYLVSYDYELLINSLNTVYDESDQIFLAIDKKRRTWAGNRFEISDTFYKSIQQFDVKNKITFFEDDFYVPELSPMENEVRERNLLLKEMGRGWLIQLDADEYACDFKSLAEQLRKKKYLLTFFKFLPVVLSGYQINLFKKGEDGFFYVSNPTFFNFVTNFPRYTGARKNQNFVNINIGSVYLHQSYAREEEEIYQKFINWGHKNDFDTEKFFNFWKKISKDNYHSIKNFHPLQPDLWRSLSFTKATSINELITNGQFQEELNFSELTVKRIFVENCKILYRRKKRTIKRMVVGLLRILKLK